MSETLTNPPAYQEIAAAIRARHLETPLDQVVGFDVETSECHTVGVLSDHGFDQAPVFRDGSPVGFVIGADLDMQGGGHIETKMQTLGPEHLVSGESSLERTIRWLAERKFLFVLDGNAITGLMTTADLNKRAGRTYFFLMLAELELVLSELIRQKFPVQPAASDTSMPQPGVLEALGHARRNGVLDRFSDDQRQGVDADLVACLTFADVCRVAENDAEIRGGLGFESKKRAKETFEPIKALRDDVMHPVRAMLTPNRPIGVLEDLDRELRGLITNATAKVGVRAIYR